jgi:hypothetical protein
LQGLTGFDVLEDRMIEHDARVFGGWTLLRQGAVGLVEFHQGPRKLTVINVNRSGVEHALGVDLVYYNHEFGSYVLVQYKRMKPRVGSGYEFRPDEQTRKELDRMRRIMPSDTAGLRSIEEFRLDPFGAYLKLCPSTVTEGFSEESSRACTSLSATGTCSSTPRVLGPKGGVVVNYDNVGRYMNNSIFIELVSASWVGSRGVTSKEIAAVIRGSLKTRSLILAEASGPAERRR